MLKLLFECDLLFEKQTEEELNVVYNTWKELSELIENLKKICEIIYLFLVGLSKNSNLTNDKRKDIWESNQSTHIFICNCFCSFVFG